jgi:hypothetical protein
VTEELSLQKYQEFYPTKIKNISEEMKPWFEEAHKRIFCLGAGERVVPIACTVMSIGFGKILYATNELGADIENCKPFILFAPDCTCSFNKMRNERGFSYGALVKGEFSGMISTNNSMPNACGYTIGELIWDKTDVALVNHLKHKQKQIGKDYLQQLGKGNHFSAVYCVKDPITGEDTMKRYINVHSSGKLGTHFLYNLEWLSDYEGYHKIETPHGPVELLEGDAKTIYLEKYHDGDKINAFYREEVLEEIIGESKFKILEEITHQGLSENGDFHRLGVQVHDGEVPIAFNSEEGMIIVKIKQNLSNEFLKKWELYDFVKDLGYEEELRKVNFSPHGGGYEFKLPVKSFTLHLDDKGIRNFDIQFARNGKVLDRIKASYFREVKEYMCFRRKLPLMREVFNADLIEHVYDLEPLMQIYPLVSIVGGTL